MRSRRTWLRMLLVALAPVLSAGAALAHGKNDLNRNHPGRAQATNGNYRRAAVILATGASADAWVRPLARALAFSAKDQTAILDRIASYRQQGEELALVALNNQTGKVAVAAIPRNKTLPVRVLDAAEIRGLGLSPQAEVVPELLSRVRGKGLPPVPAANIRPASLSLSGLSYQGLGKAPAPWPSNYRPLQPGERAVTESHISVPITARKGNIAGASIWGYVTTEGGPQ